MKYGYTNATIFFLSIAILLSVTSCGESPKVSTQWDSIIPIVEQAMKEFKVPGAAVVIVHKGNIAFMKGFGYRDLIKKLPVTPETQFAIGSCSKAFTATALGILVDQKKIGWDTPLKKYIKNLVLYDKNLTNNISVRDCLLHRTGLPNHSGDIFYGIKLVNSRSELIEKLRYLKPEVPFRSQMLYNNCMYALVGFAIEPITGTTWEEFVTNNIFKPLGMNSSHCSVKEIDMNGNVAMPYELHEKTKKLQPIAYEDISIVGPAGSIISTAKDMAQWLMFNVGDVPSEKKILTQETLEEIHRPQIKMENGKAGTQYAFGWGVDIIDEMLGHNGSFDGFLTNITIKPNKNFGFAILTNSSDSHAEAFVNTVGKQISQILKQQEYTPVPSDAYQSFIGTYKHPAYGSMNISLQDQKLSCSWGNYKSTLQHSDGYRFVSTTKSSGIEPGMLTFIFEYDKNNKGTKSLHIQLRFIGLDETFEKEQV